MFKTMNDTVSVKLSINIKNILSEYQKKANEEFLETNNEFVTFSGSSVNPIKFSKCDIKIDDIAHGLSNLCRYGGQCHRFYSVAEHCVLVSNYIEYVTSLSDLPASGLLHDATEAYLVDLPKPFKVLCPGYMILERRFSREIFEAFGLAFTFDHPIIKACDHRLYLKERSILFSNEDDRHESQDDKQLDEILKIEGLSPANAKRAFLERAEELGIKFHL